MVRTAHQTAIGLGEKDRVVETAVRSWAGKPGFKDSRVQILYESEIAIWVDRSIPMT
ncbi:MULTISPECIES: hypothetical protein [unclassified Microcoleus]|uniref:hypothetical protein n=1 Tax=unclassified Microcoleus TaxID=2642155 RepID=UPI002FD3F0FF